MEERAVGAMSEEGGSKVEVVGRSRLEEDGMSRLELGRSRGARVGAVLGLSEMDLLRTWRGEGVAEDSAGGGETIEVYGESDIM